jgi:PEP-CTERM motif
MKRAMGLVLMVSGFAVAAHADRMVYGDGVVGGHAGEVIGPQASFTEAVVAGNLADETGTTARGWSSSLSTVESPVRLTDDVNYSQFNVFAETAGDSSGFDFIRGAWDGFPGKRDDGRGDRFGIDHPEPFHRFVGVQEIPEPGTLLLMGAGLAALALWKRRTITSE